jgi:hypothetical protein
MDMEMNDAYVLVYMVMREETGLGTSTLSLVLCDTVASTLRGNCEARRKTYF